MGRPAEAVPPHYLKIGINEHVARKIGFDFLRSGVNRLQTDGGIKTLHILGTQIMV
jgi:hypothetical protein